MLKLFFVVLLLSRKHPAFPFLYRFKCIGPSKGPQLVIAGVICKGLGFVIAGGLRLSLRGSFLKQSVYYEIFRDVRNVISREKQIKGGSRAKKIELINGMNAGWKDLYKGL
ncbi:hypothetical protein KsCSTR_47120 [Candidatus Kuenenia stuttgartiensis]|uniref:Uncharacterized protein n=1 Tax=Kuenenia stuttgartiensis TaxID=174633 RepID=Q1PW27_KUEST|nr:hypothetical protein KsCSTR_47120 [Candidatus Kuenenia stuttgartiensis]CAJ71424.1 conserved hypothetical protein [Candidatus Kuenenia stuttgartiensis]SOH04845.1 hypothetical protein KSMBR1_2356 [Candidatus Kuenenia stuttgartiensis]